MLSINALTETQKTLIKNEYRVHLNSSKSIFDVDYIVDEIFDTCVMNHSIFDLSQDNEAGDLATNYYQLVYDFLEELSELEEVA
jgi:hypothetical protein